MTLPSPRLHARVESSHKHKAQTQTRPSSSRNACRVSIFALISITGLYAMGFVVCSISLSHSLVSNSDTDGTRKLTRQVNWRPIRRHGVDSGPNTTNSKSEKKWMKELLESSTSRPDLRCIGWKHVDSCNLEATNLATRNRGCDQFVRGGVGGYCLMEIEAAGQQIQVMHTACETLHPSVMLSCRHAGDFVDFQWEVAKLATAIDKETARDDKRQMTALVSPQRSEGIVMVVYPKLLVSAYASIRALRAANCTLPIELWYQESEMLTKNGESLLDVIPKKLQEECGPVTLHSIEDPSVAGFNSKVHAIIHTKFEHVLFIDADNVVVKDPIYLFKSREFLETGAVFWPDFWHPAHTIFNIHETSLLWELLDLPYTDMFEQESGQLLIDKTRSSAALRMLSLFAFYDPNPFSRYKLAHGDKDLFRLAWLKSKTPFYMVSNPPGIAGTVRGKKFCGMSMVQFDTNGEVIFLHRNAKKLTGGLGQKRKPDERIWTHLQQFQYKAAATKSALLPNEKQQTDSSRVSMDDLSVPYALLRQNYLINIFSGAPEFEKTQWCYGQSTATASKFKTIAWEDTAFPTVERSLLEYAKEAAELIVQSYAEVDTTLA